MIILFTGKQTYAQGIVLEAETGTMIGDARIESSLAGFSGTGYVTNFTAETDGVEVAINLEEAGEFTISLGFSAPNGSKENFLSVNGVVVDTVRFQEILSFTETIAGDYYLNSGENTIGFHSYWGWCHLDYVKVSDIAPRGNFTISPENPATGDTITFDASACFDPNGYITSYDWDFDDGSVDTGVIVKHVYDKAGVKNINLFLTDNDNNTSQITQQVSISRAEPYAVFTYSPEYPEPGVPVSFDGSISYDLTGTVDSYEWDFGDGTTATGVTPTHTFSTGGNYDVTLTVTNNRSRVDTRSTILYIYNSDVILRGPSISTSNPKINEKIELAFQVKADYTNPFDPSQIMVDAIVALEGTSDSIIVPCFYYEKAYHRLNEWHIDSTITGWRARLLVSDAGTYQGKLRYTGNEINYGQYFSFAVTSGLSKGIVRNDQNNPQYYRHSTGEPFYPMGINIGWGNIEMYDKTLRNITNYKANIFRYWHTPFARQALEWSTDGFYDGLVQYNQKSAGMTDSLIGLGKELGAYMQLAILQHGPFSENVNEMWDDNPYNTVNGGFVSQAEEFFYNDQCKFNTKKLLRYIIARWGYSPNIFAWEFFNEVQFTGNHPNQSSDWYNGVMQWHSEMSRYIESIDPFNHIMTTSASHNQLYDLDSITRLDVVQYHLYNEELLNAQKQDDYLFKEKLETPIINGEYGEDVSTADVPINKQQISLWNSIFTEVPHMMWLWDNYHQEQWGEIFNYPTLYLENEDFAAKSNLTTAHYSAIMGDELIESTFMKTDSSIYGVVYDQDGGVLQGVHIDSIVLPYGYYDIEYYISGSDKIVLQEEVALIRAYNSLYMPAGANDIAIKARYASDYTLPIALAGNDQLIALGNTILLDGTASFDPNAGELNYNWELVEQPASSSITIDDGTTEMISVTPDISGHYSFCLTVDNGTDFSVPDTVAIIASTKPIANAGPDIFVKPNRLGELDGSDSNDPDGEEISFLWQTISKPNDANAEIYNNTSNMAHFKGDIIGEYLVTLIVDDGIQPSLPDTVTVNVSENTGIEQLISNRIRIYPNPTTNYLNLELNLGNGNLKDYKVTSISGQQILYQNVEEMNINTRITIEIDLNSIADKKGLYFIHLGFDKGIIVRSFVII